MDAVVKSSTPVPGKVLAVVSVDIMAWNLLMPWLTALREAGYEVEIACADTGYSENLRNAGFVVHTLPFSRSFNPFLHARPLFQLWKLIRRGRFQIINAHSPVAAALGRIAAFTCSFRPVVYTVHGFYFHENAPWLSRFFFMTLEWVLGGVTDAFMFVSDEDHRTARLKGIARTGASTTTIWNGIDLKLFSPVGRSAPESQVIRQNLGIPNNAPVVCIVGRIVKEKGHREFLEMAAAASQARPDVHFMVVGSTLASDRDQFGNTFNELVRSRGLSNRFHLTGQVRSPAAYLGASDIFVLPSYREGFPRSVIEAMGCGLPVVATNIRGCREGVVDGVTGFIVAPRDPSALTERVLYLLDNPEAAAEMGRQGRDRAVRLYDEKAVRLRFVRVIQETVTRFDVASPADRSFFTTAK
jgi:glycosyltransferase involved in cell wall biosynthesis